MHLTKHPPSIVLVVDVPTWGFIGIDNDNDNNNDNTFTEHKYRLQMKISI